MAMEGAWSKIRWARCAGCRMRIILSGCPFGGLGGQGKAGRRHFALIVFAPHLQFWNGFLTWPVFADTIILACLETTRLVELLRVPSPVKAEPSVATREPSTMAPKGAFVVAGSWAHLMSRWPWMGEGSISRLCPLPGSSSGESWPSVDGDGTPRCRISTPSGRHSKRWMDLLRPGLLTPCHAMRAGETRGRSARRTGLESGGTQPSSPQTTPIPAANAKWKDGSWACRRLLRKRPPPTQHSSTPSQGGGGR